MNKFVLLFVITFACVYADSESSESSSELLNVMAEKLNSLIAFDLQQIVKRINQDCPGVGKRLNVTLDAVHDCVSDVELGDDTLCSMIKNNLEKCLAPVTRLLEGCLPQDSKRIPYVVVKSLRAVVDQACRSTGEEVLELLNPCGDLTNITSIASCKRLLDSFDGYQKRIPTTALVCSALSLSRTCLADFYKVSSCHFLTSRVDHNFSNAIYNATETECQNANRVV